MSRTGRNQRKLSRGRDRSAHGWTARLPRVRSVLTLYTPSCSIPNYIRHQRRVHRSPLNALPGSRCQRISSPSVKKARYRTSVTFEFWRWISSVAKLGLRMANWREERREIAATVRVVRGRWLAASRKMRSCETLSVCRFGNASINARKWSNSSCGHGIVSAHIERKDALRTVIVKSQSPSTDRQVTLGRLIFGWSHSNEVISMSDSERRVDGRRLWRIWYRCSCSKSPSSRSTWSGRRKVGKASSSSLRGRGVFACAGNAT